jgi:subtilisin family serine protease
MRKYVITAAMFLATASFVLKAQNAVKAPLPTVAEDKAPDNWFNLDPEMDKVPGMSVERTYKELLADKTSVKVVVAVIDSGVDSEHPDLKDVMWTNPGEIAGNGIDDDKNGYIDDVHGWNFIGGKDGKNVDQDTYEFVRLINKFDSKFKGKTAADIAPADKADFEQYTKAVKEYDEKNTTMGSQYNFIKPIAESIDEDVALVKKEFGLDVITPDKLPTIKTDKKDVKAALGNMRFMAVFGAKDDKEFVDDIKEYNKYFSDLVEYSLNKNFDPRSIVGDNYNDSSERNYGNNDVKGADASHGTHVAGIIAANRKNDIGIKGVADNVSIMAVRVVPNGDERDKDVANGIRYAADNGAQIINMSFGKYFASDKKAVDEAVKYAQSKGVLLIQAAGNDSYDLDAFGPHFPDRNYVGGGQAANWIVVGASSWKNDADGVAGFSNYGKKSVDIFSPGVDIYSTTPDGQYKSNSGTSMASPAATGVAAVLKSYFPHLTPDQIKSIMLKSVKKQGKRKVNKPGTGGGPGAAPELTTFSSLCNTAGIVNLYTAVKLAQKVKVKKPKK